MTQAEMLEENIAIRISGIRKQYRLGSIGGRTLQAELQSWWAKKRGKEDPNLRIGTDPRFFGQIFWALDGVDLTIHRGERVGIIGANGAGKSTLLKLLCRVTAPTEGEIDISGRITSMLEVGTGFHGEMTGRENIYMNGAILGMKKSEIDERMEEIIEFSEVEEFIDTPIKRYSSGMFVKLAFSVAAHLRSEIMIMDEVLAVGDVAFQTKCLDKMREAAEQEGRTILYVSHNMNTIRNLCDKCVVLDKGKIIYEGEVDKAIALYMDRGMSGMDVDIDLSAIERPFFKTIKPKIIMNRVVLTGKTTPTYEDGEDMKLKLSCTINEPVPKTRLGVIFKNESNVGIASAYSREIDLEPGEQTINFTVPLSQIRKGVFYIGLGFFYDTEIGYIWAHDFLQRVFRVEILTKTPWGTDAIGYIQLPGLISDI